VTRRDAAVLIPVYRSADGHLHLVLVRRSDGGVHGGQLAFPGGKPDPADISMRETALREAHEEIGVSPELLDIIAELPAVETKTTGFRVVPFLARVIKPGQWRACEREVAEIVDVRLADLALPEAHGVTIEQFPTWPAPQEVPFYRIGAYRLWGFSYRVLHPLLPRLLANEWRI
jgi:8-oxo-dGTP pyrophosphatase MutT (NUDIX family)